jgi:hypothetical protein
MKSFYKFFFFPIFIIFVVIISAGYSSEMKSDNRNSFDGYWWQTLPYEFQLGFILGYQEGFKMALGEIVARKKNFPGSLENISLKDLADQFYLKSRYTCGQIAQELNKLYQDEANKPIYIHSAINISLMKLNHVSEANIKKAIIQYRKAKEIFEKETKSECSEEHIKTD